MHQKALIMMKTKLQNIMMKHPQNETTNGSLMYQCTYRNTHKHKRILQFCYDQRAKKKKKNSE